ncbi:MAG: isopentenyl-diphosphate Delta-isomerase [Lentisphaeraceae bacterium]|nr:isopentenyl-diphosphate Delta-isomerase [Lentisphaeraceae bacterium]
MEYVILVDTEDNEIGKMEKMQAHEESQLHRAFSVFLFNEKGEMLIHRRADHKYHSGGLWTNACCSHPRPGEATEAAAHRRLGEELGMDCEIEEKFSFLYKRALDHGLTEHELDHVFTGSWQEIPDFNEDEVAECKFISIDDLQDSMSTSPELYTEWFRIVCEQHGEKIYSTT